MSTVSPPPLSSYTRLHLFACRRLYVRPPVHRTVSEAAFAVPCCVNAVFSLCAVGMMFGAYVSVSVSVFVSLCLSVCVCLCLRRLLAQR